MKHLASVFVAFRHQRLIDGTDGSAGFRASRAACSSGERRSAACTSRERGSASRARCGTGVADGYGDVAELTTCGREKGGNADEDRDKGRVGFDDQSSHE
jgi:hypothetical protein